MGFVRRALVGTVIGALTGLVTLASASPPDPVWISGIYDEADYDDVVGLVTSGDTQQTEILAEFGTPSAIVGLLLGPHPDSLRAVAIPRTLRLRSPPLA